MKWWKEEFQNEQISEIIRAPISQESYAAIVVQGHVTQAAIRKLIDLLEAGMDAWPAAEAVEGEGECHT